MPPSPPCPALGMASRRLHLGLLAAVGTFAVLTLLGGCAAPAGGRLAPINRWTQMAPDDTISLRAIVAGDAECPVALVDGTSRPMLPRAGATRGALPDSSAASNPAFEPAFAVTTCELTLPRTARQASIDGQPMALPGADIRRIVVVGDTGCRVQVAASGASAPIQDCTNPARWPWPKIAGAAARTQPDLVIHVGDYHYREYCNDPALCSPLLAKGVVIGYDWAGWNADFFTPATPLLAAAPWVVVRGNHENCDRAGAGWLRFLSPLPYQTCSNQSYKTASHSLLTNNLTADTYRIDLGSELTLVVADNAGFQDYLPAGKTPQDGEIFRNTLQALHTPSATQPVWLLLHKPLWYDLLPPSAEPNALQAHLRNTLPANVQFLLAGHEHAFETINFAPSADHPANYPTGRPAQVIVGGSGTQLEAFDPLSPFYEGQGGAGSKERSHPAGLLYDGVAASSGILLNRYSFLLLERDDAGWAGTLMDPDGAPISRCRLNGERKQIACVFPGRQRRE